MLLNALFFLIGILVFATKNTLIIHTYEIIIIVAILSIIFFTYKYNKYNFSSKLLFAICGFFWIAIVANHTIENKVDDKYLNKQIQTIGYIANLVTTDERKSTFLYQVIEPFNAKVRLSWYFQDKTNLNTGDKWLLNIKLKQNNGFRNEGGFDYEKWLFANKINATGYVRKSDANKILTNSNFAFVNQIRQSIREKVSPYLQDLSFSGVINALIIGDRSMIKDSNWELFKATNTTHLSVISGLHIGLISTLFFFIASFLWKRSPSLLKKIPAQIIGAYFGIIGALSYTFIAGFSIPTQRAFIMASIAFLSIILRLQYSHWSLYAVALIAVLIINPLSIYDVGFWLSFYVVGIILYGVSLFTNKTKITKIICLQLLIFIAMLPLTSWFFQANYSISSIANLIAIPVFSIFVTPLSLLGSLFAILDIENIANICFLITNKILDILALFLTQLSSLPFNKIKFSPNNLIDLVILLIGFFVLIMPRGLKLKKIAILLIAIPILIKNPIPTNTAIVDVLDVGQGLAVVVRTQNHTLIYDTGSSSASGFNMGDAVINPFLITNKINKIDMIVISHGDNDHIGGLDAILNNFKVTQVITSAPEKINSKSEICKTGQNWIWDNIKFEILNPQIKNNLKGNNASCVLKVSSKNLSLLLTGDIEKKAEKKLLENKNINLKADIMTIPHHGSKTSSSEEFIQAVSPKIAISSAGYKNPFKHPTEVVLKRYRKNSIKLLDTICSGQISFILDDNINIKEYRKDNKNFYNRICN